MSELRQRKSSNPLAPLIELDAFSKLPEEVEEKTSIGAYDDVDLQLILNLVIDFQVEQFH
jgi:hypothetical protein